MKKFIIRTIGYAVLFIGICFMLSIAADKGLERSQSNEIYDWQQIINGEINVEVLITGSSRAMRMIDPKILETNLGVSSYNIGMEGARLNTQLTRWDSYMKYNKVPKVVVQTVDLMSMGHGNTIFKKEQYLPYLSEAAVYDRLKELDNRLFLDRYFPLYKYHGYFEEFKQGILLISGMQTSHQYSMYKGYKAKDKVFNKEFQQMKDTLTQNTLLHPEKLIEEGFTQLKYIINDCEKRNIQLVLVLTPQYVGLTELQDQLDELVSKFEELGENENVFFLNYLNVSYTGDKDYFYNAMHLNLKGANAFSQELASDLGKIIEQ